MRWHFTDSMATLVPSSHAMPRRYTTPGDLYDQAHGISAPADGGDATADATAATSSAPTMLKQAPLLPPPLSASRARAAVPPDFAWQRGYS